MSSSDGDRGRRAGRASLLALAAALALSACTVQPLYAPTANGTAVQSILAKIAIDAPTTRAGQIVRNKLIFGFGGGEGPPASPVYQMSLTVGSYDIPLGINDVDSAPSYAVVVSATYSITQIANKTIVLHGTVQNQAVYDRVNQYYANTRAHLDAENRAATLVAQDIQNRIAVAAVNGLNPPVVAAATPPPAK